MRQLLGQSHGSFTSLPKATRSNRRNMLSSEGQSFGTRTLKLRDLGCLGADWGGEDWGGAACGRGAWGRKPGSAEASRTPDEPGVSAMSSDVSGGFGSRRWNVAFEMFGSAASVACPLSPCASLPRGGPACAGQASAWV